MKAVGSHGTTYNYSVVTFAKTDILNSSKG